MRPGCARAVSVTCAAPLMRRKHVHQHLQTAAKDSDQTHVGRIHVGARRPPELVICKGWCTEKRAGHERA